MQKINRALTMNVPVNGLGRATPPINRRVKQFGVYDGSFDMGLGRYNNAFTPGKSGLGYLGQSDALDAAVDAGVTDATALATTYINNDLAGHPWITAQNTAEAGIASVVAAYVALKNNASGNLLTPQYIQQAILKVQAIAQGFVNYAKTFNTPAATKGGQDIQNNANAVVTNMQVDASQLPYNAALGTSGSASTSISSLVTSLTSNPTLLIGVAVIVLMMMRKE